MKRYFTVAFLWLVLIFQSGAQNNLIQVCSGQSKTLEVTSFIPGSAFSWFLDNVSLNVTASKYLIPAPLTSVQVHRKYSCYLKLQGIPYDTVDFIVDINPVPLVDIVAEDVCEGKLAKLSFTNSSDIAKQTWTIGNEIFFNKNIEYLCGASPVSIKLGVENKYGCRTEISRTFTINLKPVCTIDEKELTKNFVKGVYCGNSLAEYELKGLTGNSKITGWKLNVNNQTKISVNTGKNGRIVPADRSLADWVEINGTSLRVKWIKTNTSYNVRIVATFTNGYCEYQAEINTILINDNTPDIDSVYQKPGSNVLIYPTGQSKTTINYEWGYTSSTGSDISVKKSKVFYNQYDKIDTANKYWVETWFTTNDVCRIRNFVSKVSSTSSKSAVSFRFYPNPAENNLVVQFDNPEPGKILITDMTGITYKNVPVTNESGSVSINVEGMKTGIYLISYLRSSGETLASDNFIIK